MCCTQSPRSSSSCTRPTYIEPYFVCNAIGLASPDPCQSPMHVHASLSTNIAQGIHLHARADMMAQHRGLHSTSTAGCTFAFCSCMGAAATQNCNDGGCSSSWQFQDSWGHCHPLWIMRFHTWHLTSNFASGVACHGIGKRALAMTPPLYESTHPFAYCDWKARAQTMSEVAEGANASHTYTRKHVHTGIMVSATCM